MSTKRVMLIAMAVIFVAALPASADWDLKGYEWAIVLDDDTMRVSDDDHKCRDLDRLRDEYSGPFVWVRRGDSEWVITDSGFTGRLREMMGEIHDLEIDLEMEIERELEGVEFEESMRRLERSVEKIERDLDGTSLESTIESALEIAKAAQEIEVEHLEVMAERLGRHARALDDWVDEFQERLEEEAVPLIEDAIRSGRAKRVR